MLKINSTFKEPKRPSVQEQGHNSGDAAQLDIHMALSESSLLSDEVSQGHPNRLSTVVAQSGFTSQNETFSRLNTAVEDGSNSLNCIRHHAGDTPPETSKSEQAQ